jgi:hypothetical protein
VDSSDDDEVDNENADDQDRYQYEEVAAANARGQKDKEQEETRRVEKGMGRKRGIPKGSVSNVIVQDEEAMSLNPEDGQDVEGLSISDSGDSVLVSKNGGQWKSTHRGKQTTLGQVRSRTSTERGMEITSSSKSPSHPQPPIPSVLSSFVPNTGQTHTPDDTPPIIIVDTSDNYIQNPPPSLTQDVTPTMTALLNQPAPDLANLFNTLDPMLFPPSSKVTTNSFPTSNISPLADSSSTSSSQTPQIPFGFEQYPWDDEDTLFQDLLQCEISLVVFFNPLPMQYLLTCAYHSFVL